MTYMAYGYDKLTSNRSQNTLELLRVLLFRILSKFNDKEYILLSLVKNYKKVELVKHPNIAIAFVNTLNIVTQFKLS